MEQRIDTAYVYPITKVNAQKLQKHIFQRENSIDLPMFLSKISAQYFKLSPNDLVDNGQVVIGGCSISLYHFKPILLLHALRELEQREIDYVEKRIVSPFVAGITAP